MAELTTGTGRRDRSSWRAWMGRMVAFACMAAAVGMGWGVLGRVDDSPGTHDAFVYADSIGMAPDVSGRIVALGVKPNDRVEKGTTVLQIDPEPFELRVRQTEAQVAALKAEIDLTARQVAAQGSGADAARSQIDKARSQLSLARDTVGRLEPLLSKGYVTAQRMDEARADEKTAQASFDAAVRQARQASQAIGDTASLTAQLDSALAAAALAKRDLRNTRLVAPFDGLVVGLDLAEGAFASAGHPLFTLIKAHDWYAVANFRETELPHIAPGDPATVWMVADGNRVVKGHVESIGWGVRPEDGGGPSLPSVGRTLNWVVVAQRFPVRIRLDDPPEESMRVGETVTVRVFHGAGR